MCYWVGTKNVRKTLLEVWQENPDDEIANAFYETFEAPEATNQFKEYGVAIGKGKPTITVISSNDNNLNFEDMTWTLPWSYTNKNGETYNRQLLNSTCEKVLWQHKDIINTKRIVIPVDGYFEFYHQKKKTYPHFLFHPDKRVMYLGGIYTEVPDQITGEILKFFSIITTPPNEIAKWMHNNPKAPNGSRMLLIIPEHQIKEYLDKQLAQKELKNFFKPYNPDDISYHTVARFLTKEFSHVISTSEAQEKFVYPELSEGLF